MSNYIVVEVALAMPDQQIIEKLSVMVGTTVMDAILQSKLYSNDSCLQKNNFSFGIYGKECEPGNIVAEHDRIEIYRELQQDPKDRRKRLSSGI